MFDYYIYIFFRWLLWLARFTLVLRVTRKMMNGGN